MGGAVNELRVASYGFNRYVAPCIPQGDLENRGNSPIFYVFWRILNEWITQTQNDSFIQNSFIQNSTLIMSVNTIDQQALKSGIIQLFEEDEAFRHKIVSFF